MIPRSQLYYWTRTWQEGEAAALADLEAGRSRVFTDPRELARYLLRPTDDE
jgi:transposase-like protein